jgi:hypothetical protein
MDTLQWKYVYSFNSGDMAIKCYRYWECIKLVYKDLMYRTKYIFRGHEFRTEKAMCRYVDNLVEEK